MTARLDGEGNLRYLSWTEHWNHRPLGDVWKPKHLNYSVTKIYIYPSGQKKGYTYIFKIFDLIFYFALRYFKHTPGDEGHWIGSWKIKSIWLNIKKLKVHRFKYIKF